MLYELESKLIFTLNKMQKKFNPLNFVYYFNYAITLTSDSAAHMMNTINHTKKHTLDGMQMTSTVMNVM